jgi:hypothetical protein
MTPSGITMNLSQSKDRLTLSRRDMLGRAASAASLMVSCAASLAQAKETRAPIAVDESRTDQLKPLDAIPAVLDALRRYPLVALAERHLLQEWHDFTTALLFHPSLPVQLTDIVVEFGNALHQDIADRFILEGKAVANADLQKIWRHTIGGNVLWDAPVYGQFFRSVRAVNALRPAKQRLRVLLGDPPFDCRKVRGVDDKKYLQSMQAQRDAHYAGVVDREVLKKEGRALLIAGSAHLLRGIHLRDHVDELNAASRLAQRWAERLFVIDPLILPPDPSQDALTRRVQACVASWPHPAIALLAGTWLGPTTESVRPWINSLAHLATSAENTRYGAQADAVLYLGPAEQFTASRADPAIYHWGDYPKELQRLSRIATDLGHPTDLVAEGLRRAEGPLSWFAQWR